MDLRQYCCVQISFSAAPPDKGIDTAWGVWGSQYLHSPHWVQRVHLHTTHLCSNVILHEFSALHFLAFQYFQYFGMLPITCIITQYYCFLCFQKKKTMNVKIRYSVVISCASYKEKNCSVTTGPKQLLSPKSPKFPDSWGKHPHCRKCPFLPSLLVLWNKNLFPVHLTVPVCSFLMHHYILCDWISCIILSLSLIINDYENLNLCWITMHLP